MKLVCILAVIAAVGAAAELEGRVVDAWTRLPVPYADIHILSTDLRVSADSVGRFFAVVPGDSAALVASRIGYYSSEWSGRIGPRPLTLALRPQALHLDGVTVSASRTPLPLYASAPVSVIERRASPPGRPAEPAEAVRTIGGVEVRDYGNYSSIGLRGANAEHTLIALDGVRQNSSQSGTLDLSTLALSFADRVEVARGASSAVFGSGPVGGVVNLVTPEPDRLSTEVAAGLGSFGRRNVDFRHSNWVAPVGYIIAGDVYTARNDFAFAVGDSARRLANADITREALLVKGRYQSGPHHASLLGELGAARRGVPGTVQFPSDSARREDLRGQVIARYSLQPTGNLRTDARVYASETWQNYRDPVWATDDTHRISTGGLAVEQFWQVTRNIGLVGAVEYSDERLQSSAVGSPRRGVWAGTFQFRVQVHGFDVVHVFRYDRTVSEATPPDSVTLRSTTGAFSPKVMAVFTGLRPLEVYSALGRAWRAPSFNDLYWPADAFTYGNPNLRPETGRSAEFGLGAALNRTSRFRAGVFYNGLADLIQWQPDSLFRFHPVNVQQAGILGIEVEGRVELGPAGLDVSAAWTRARSDSLALIYRPELAGSARVFGRLPLPALSPEMWLVAAYTGPRFADPANTDTLPGHALIDLGLRLSPRIGPLSLAVESGLRNLLDSRYETTRGYPAPGRNWHLRMELGI